METEFQSVAEIPQENLPPFGLKPADITEAVIYVLAAGPKVLVSLVWYLNLKFCNNEPSAFSDKRTNYSTNHGHLLSLLCPCCSKLSPNIIIMH